MLDLRTIARDPGPVREALARRRDGSDERLDEALALRERRNVLTHEWETARARQKEASEAIGRAKMPAALQLSMDGGSQLGTHRRFRQPAASIS